MLYIKVYGIYVFLFIDIQFYADDVFKRIS